ncbi:hypothetical protein CFM90_14505 [Ralstonia solanacearum]|nr:hypothetical protein CFM90_14505 [Ralstonia solanacearum]
MAARKYSTNRIADIRDIEWARHCRALPRYYLRAPIIGALASQARHDCCPQSPMIRGVLSPGLVGGW